MKTISKIFALLFGLSQVKQSLTKDSYIQRIERESELFAESFTNSSKINVNSRFVYPKNPIVLSKLEFAKHMYNTQRVICL